MVDDAAASGALLVVVAAALTDEAGRVLVQRRPEGRHYAGYWEFPGGKVERGEGPEEALARELGEELGIVVDPAAFLPATFATGIAGDRRLLLLLFTATRWLGTPAALEAGELAWRAPADLRTLKMPPADLPLVEWLCRAQSGPRNPFSEPRPTLPTRLATGA